MTIQCTTYTVNWEWINRRKCLGNVQKETPQKRGLPNGFNSLEKSTDARGPGLFERRLQQELALE